MRKTLSKNTTGHWDRIKVVISKEGPKMYTSFASSSLHTDPHGSIDTPILIVRIISTTTSDTVELQWAQAVQTPKKHPINQSCSCGRIVQLCAAVTCLLIRGNTLSMEDDTRHGVSSSPPVCHTTNVVH